MSTSFKPRTTVVTIYQGDDQERIDDLARRIENAEKAIDRSKRQGGTATLDESVESPVELREELQAVTDEAEPRAIKVRLRALARKRWHALVEQHKPRAGHEGDAAVGVNEETFAEPLVQECIVEPFASVAERDEFLDAISSAQFDLIYFHAFTINRAVGASAPKGRS